MKPLTQRALERLLERARPKLVIAAGAVTILAVGYRLAPPARTSKETPRESVAPILERQVERREPFRVFRGVQDTGREALVYGAVFPAGAPAAWSMGATLNDFASPGADASPPQGFGLVAGADGEVLSHVGALGGRVDPLVQLADGLLARGQVVAHELDTGLVLVRLIGTAPQKLPPLAQSPPAPGELAVAAARVDGRDFVAPVFVASTAGDHLTITAAGGGLAPGTPIFNLAGEALAVAAGGGQAGAAFGVGAAVERLSRLAASGRPLPGYVGVSMQPLTSVLAARWGEGAGVVSDLREGGPAERAGVEPGDVLVGVGDSTPASMEEAMREISRLPPGEPVTILVRRERKPREIALTPEPALVLAAQEPPSRPVPPGVPLAGSVFDAAALAASGVPARAHVLAVDGTPVTPRAGVPALLRRSRPPWIIRLQAGSQRFYAVVEETS